MPLMKISEYRATQFTTDSAPTVATVRKWIDNGEIFGKIIGGVYFVDPDKIIPANELVNKVVMQ